ncbi:MAG: hypothetical protein KC560_02095 [Myxococcales bacterium]|nr:hypothetical protein [Myxococcales bacterium]
MRIRDDIEGMSLALSAGAVGAAYALAPAPFADGLAIGAAIEGLNLRAQVRAARHFFRASADAEQGAGPWIGGFGFRFGLTAAAVIAALHFGTDPAGLLLGLSLAMPAVVVWAWRNRPPVVAHELAAPLEPDDPSWDNWSIWRATEVEPPTDEERDDRGMQIIP